jgi:hypothetical protein
VEPAEEPKKHAHVIRRATLIAGTPTRCAQERGGEKPGDASIFSETISDEYQDGGDLGNLLEQLPIEALQRAEANQVTFQEQLDKLEKELIEQNDPEFDFSLGSQATERLQEDALYETALFLTKGRIYGPYDQDELRNQNCLRIANVLFSDGGADTPRPERAHEHTFQTLNKHKPQGVDGIMVLGTARFMDFHFGGTSFNRIISCANMEVKQIDIVNGVPLEVIASARWVGAEAIPVRSQSVPLLNSMRGFNFGEVDPKVDHTVVTVSYADPMIALPKGARPLSLHSNMVQRAFAQKFIQAVDHSTRHQKLIAIRRMKESLTHTSGSPGGVAVAQRMVANVMHSMHYSVNIDEANTAVMTGGSHGKAPTVQAPGESSTDQNGHLLRLVVPIHKGRADDPTPDRPATLALPIGYTPTGQGGKSKITFTENLIKLHYNDIFNPTQPYHRCGMGEMMDSMTSTLKEQGGEYRGMEGVYQGVVTAHAKDSKQCVTDTHGQAAHRRSSRGKKTYGEVDEVKVIRPSSGKGMVIFDCATAHEIEEVKQLKAAIKSKTSSQASLSIIPCTIAIGRIVTRSEHKESINDDDYHWTEADLCRLATVGSSDDRLDCPSRTECTQYPCAFRLVAPLIQRHTRRVLTAARMGTGAALRPAVGHATWRGHTVHAQVRIDVQPVARGERELKSHALSTPLDGDPDSRKRVHELLPNLWDTYLKTNDAEALRADLLDLLQRNKIMLRSNRPIEKTEEWLGRLFAMVKQMRSRARKQNLLFACSCPDMAKCEANQIASWCDPSLTCEYDWLGEEMEVDRGESSEAPGAKRRTPSRPEGGSPNPRSSRKKEGKEEGETSAQEGETPKSERALRSEARRASSPVRTVENIVRAMEDTRKAPSSGKGSGKGSSSGASGSNGAGSSSSAAGRAQQRGSGKGMQSGRGRSGRQ